MKILIICNSASGLEVFRGMLIQKIIEEGHTISSIIPLATEQKELDSEIQIEKWGCKLIRIPMQRRGMNPLKDFSLLKAYYKTLKVENPDLVITYTIKPNIYGGLVSRLLKIQYVVNITGLGTAFQGDGILKHLVIKMYKIALKHVKIVFFENVENRNTIVNYKIVPIEKTKVLSGAGVDLERFQCVEYPKDSEKIKFLFIGRIMQEKGINELFFAMHKLVSEGVNCELDVLGGFEENYKEIIKKYEDEGWLHYHGFQSDVRPFIEKCHCFVLPSWHEGMANTNLESAASGRPLITTKIHGCLEAVIENKSGFLVERKNADDLFEKMKSFTELSYEERKAMGLASRKHMENVFDKKVVVNETVSKLL